MAVPQNPFSTGAVFDWVHAKGWRTEREIVDRTPLDEMQLALDRARAEHAEELDALLTKIYTRAVEQM